MRNLITEFKAFNERLNLNPLTAGQIALFYALLYINNKCAWQEWFNVPNITLELHSGLSKSSLIRARNSLKQYGYIDFKVGKSNKATAYKLLSFAFQYDTQTDTQTDTQSDTQTDTQSDTINIQDVDTDTDRYNSSIISSKLKRIATAVEENVCQVTSMVLSDIEMFLEDADEDLIIFAVREAHDNNAKNWNYVKAIIRNLLREGVKTGAEARRRKEEYIKQKKDAAEKKAAEKSGKVGKKFSDYSLKTSYDYDALEARALNINKGGGKK